MTDTYRPLTAREIDVLRSYCENETHEAAAEALKMGVQTLKNHLSKIYAKIGVRKAHAAVYKLGLSDKPVFAIGPNIQTDPTITKTAANHQSVIIRNATYYPGASMTASGTMWQSVRWVDHLDGTGHYEGEPS